MLRELTFPTLNKVLQLFIEVWKQKGFVITTHTNRVEAFSLVLLRWVAFLFNVF